MSLLIGIHINEKLTGAENVKQYVNDKIFPVSTISATTFPFIVYRRTALADKATKDRYSTGNDTTVEITVVGDKYFETVKIANAVRKALQNKRGDYDEFNVIDAKLVAADEHYIEDSHVQRLVFSFETEE